MPLEVDNIIQENSGGSSAAAATIVPTLPVGTTAGNTLLVVLNGFTFSSTAPSGFVLDLEIQRDLGASQRIQFWRKSNIGAGETSWTFTPTTSDNSAWYVAEVEGVDPYGPLDATAWVVGSGTVMANGATVSTGTSGQNRSLVTMALAAHATHQATGPDLGSWSGQTNGFEEVLEVASTAAGTSNYGIAVSRMFVSGFTQTFECTGTWAAGGTAVRGYAGAVVYRAVDSPVINPLTWQMGFEHGTHFGIDSTITVGFHGSNLLEAIVGTVGTDLTVASTSARDAGYGMRIVQSGAAKYISVGEIHLGTDSPGLAAGWNVKVVSSTGVVVLAEVAPFAGPSAFVVYDTSTQKVGVRWDTGGTVSYQSGTTAPGAWAWVDLRVSGVKGATWHIDWRLETAPGVYTTQASPADLTGQSASTVSSMKWGGNVAQTVTQDVDDLCVSNIPGVYPLGPHKLRALKVDPAGTPSVVGTVADFSTFSNNTTLTAWNATTARDALDDLPPTISATSDGVCQDAADAAGYMQFPMDTYVATPSEAITGVRMLAAMWGGTGANTGTLGIRGYDGTTETVLLPNDVFFDADSLTTPSATVPPWVAYMWNPVGGWTQAKLNAAALRVGFSSDATPDMGVHAIYLEVAIRPAIVERVLSAEDDAFTVDLRMDPYSSASVSYLVTCPAGRAATFNYSIFGTPQTPVSCAAGTTTEVTLGAAAFGEVSYIDLTPDPV